MGPIRYTLTVLIAAAAALPRRWLRGARHPAWSWRTELIASVARAATFGMVGAPIPRIRMLLPGAMIHPVIGRGMALDTIELAGRPAEVHTPHGWRRDQPTVLYLHGGGYAVCSPATHRDLISRLTQASGARSIALDYRLAPESPYPAALQDVLAAVSALSEDSVPPTQLWLAGDSAGGGLAIATLLSLRDQGRPMPAGALLLSPWVDLTEAGLSSELDNPHDYLSSGLLQIFRNHYTHEGASQDPLISPVLADLTGLPPLYIQAGGAEIFRPQIQRFADRARAAGVPVVLEVSAGMLHVYQAMAVFLPEAREALRSLGRFVREQRSTQVETKL